MHENLLYTQLFIDYLSDKDASSIKFLMKLDFSCGIVHILVVNNFAAYHGDAELALQSLELLYLPAYSPDLNPDEEVFSKLKYLLKTNIKIIVFKTLEYAVWCAVGDLGAADMYGYYHCAGHFMLCVNNKQIHESEE